MGICTLMLALLATPGPQEARALTIHNPHDLTVKVWVWDYEAKAWLYKDPIVLGRGSQVDPVLRPGKYQFVFKNSDGVLVRSDSVVSVVEGSPVFVRTVTVPVMQVIMTRDPETGAMVQKVVTESVQRQETARVLEIPMFPGKPDASSKP